MEAPDAIRKNWIFGIVSYKASETDSSIQQVFYKVLHNYADARSLARKEGRSTITFRELVRGTPVENLEGKTGVGMSGQEVPLVMDVEDQDDFFNRNYKIF